MWIVAAVAVLAVAAITLGLYRRRSPASAASGRSRRTRVEPHI